MIKKRRREEKRKFKHSWFIVVAQAGEFGFFLRDYLPSWPEDWKKERYCDARGIGVFAIDRLTKTRRALRRQDFR